MKFMLIPAIFIALCGICGADIADYHKAQFRKITFNKHGVAHILTKDGWIAVNKKKKILYKPFIYDNGPDYVQEGLLRFVENGKMGFVDEAGRKIIPAQYDFVFPFSSGSARFCNNCRSVRVGEHSTIDEKTGTWGKIDKKGLKIP